MVMTMQLSELDQRVLSELYEAGGETVQTLAVTVLDGQGDANELASLTEALVSLVQVGHALIAVEDTMQRKLQCLSTASSVAEINALQSFLYFDTTDKRWKDKRRTTPPYRPEPCYVVNTEQGRQLGFEILNARGYQWWRSRQ